VNDTLKIAGLGLVALIFFVIGMLYSGGTPNQLVVPVTVMPDKTAQASMQEQLDEISTYTSGAMATEVNDMIIEALYVADATRQIEFQTAIANGEHGIYQRIKIQLQSEGMSFDHDTPTPIQTIVSSSK